MCSYAIAYARKSAQAQKTQTQMNGLHSYAQREGITIKYSFQENASGKGVVKNGSLQMNKEFAKVFNKLHQDSSIKFLLVTNLSRLSRSSFMTKILEKLIKTLGIEIIETEKDKRINSKNLTYLRSECESHTKFSEDILEKIKKTKEQQNLLGVVVDRGGSIVYGYKRSSLINKYDVDPLQAKIINKIFDLHILKNQTVNAIVKNLNVSQGQSSKSRKWNSQRVYRILNKREIYSGYGKYPKLLASCFMQ